MQQLRVVDLARTMGISPKELIFKLRSIGVSVSGEEDALDLSTVRSIITGETLQKRPREVIVRPEAREEEAQTSTARDRMARRRRRQVVQTEKEIREFATPPPEEGEPSEHVEEVPAEPVVAAEAAAQASLEAAELTEAAEVPEVEEIGEVEGVAAAAGAPFDGSGEAEVEVEEKPEFEITEEELTASRKAGEEAAPLRVRPIRAKTPLEQGLRELTPDEIKESLEARKRAEQRRKVVKPGAGKKAKAAADAKEIRELLTKFEEQKLKGQQEGAAPTRPGPRPGDRRPTKKARRRLQRDETTPAPPQPTRTVQFRDGERPDGPIILSEMVTARELAEKLNVTAKDLLALLIAKGVMVTTNQSLPHELAEEICEDLGIEAMVASAEEVLEYEREESLAEVGPALPRPPVVTVMGHVDHGKTSLLDAIRSTRVAEHEAGGITQHIGASRIETDDGRVVVFVDTPGHEAFTQMRARGAQVTDIVVLVVAADDGVMPQTEEAINHARAANVPLMVAINKIDKGNANPDRVKQQLAEHGVLVDDWGGEVPSVQVSAKTRKGISDLLDMILLVAEMKNLKATVEGPARGVVLEARKEKGRGIVASIVVQQGTLSVGDFFFCGSTWGRVRAITNDRGDRVDTAGPSDPVEVIGFEAVPAAGDVLQGTESESKAVEVSSYRSLREKEEGHVAGRKISLENLFDQIAESEVKELNVVVKADVQGSVEVLREALSALSTERVKINHLHGSVGAITTNDVMLASASNAIIIGFSVRPERTARELAETEQVDIRLYTVIYDLIDDVKKAMVGLLEPVFHEEELGHAEVREVFRVPKIGAIAGSHVTDGIITRTAKVRLLRDHVVVYEGQVSSLRRFKDDASEVRQGFDCGIGLDRYQDIKVGDVIEAFRMVEVAPEL
ncbi:MAG: translation initiation factor IF-2 [Holophagae bacterium]|nr:MAG: translation initiation factor IF-2 [Holophagae bacterium]